MAVPCGGAMGTQGASPLVEGRIPRLSSGEVSIHSNGREQGLAILLIDGA